MKTTGARLKAIRLSLGLSQEDIAELLETSKSYISLVETDKSKLSVENLIKLLLNYGINLNYLLAGIGQPILASQYEDVRTEILAEVERMLKEKGL
jgi:transcriptional regulator with XRE-family HTH domain